MSNSTWTLVPLAECVTSVRAGVSVNSEDRPHAAGEIGVLKTSSVSGGVFKANEHKTVLAGDRLRVAEPVLGGSVLVSRMNTPLLVGEACYVESDHPALFLPDRLWQLRTEPSRVDSRWLAYVLQSAEVSSAIKALATGTSGSMKNIAKRGLLALNILLPPVDEQRRIAAIFTAVDEQISLAEQIVAKLESCKTGLLEDVVGSRTPNATLVEVLADAPANGIYKPAHLIGRGTLLVGQTAFTPERRVDPAAARRAVVTRGEVRRFGLLANDILVSRVFATLDGVGRPAFVTDLTEDAVYESNMMRIRCDAARAEPFFAFQTLLTASARAHIVRRANLSNQASIAQSALTELPIWLPSLSQQRRVAEELGSLDATISAEQSVLAKLTAEKNGLLVDLLRGRVRVPVGVAS